VSTWINRSDETSRAEHMRWKELFVQMNSRKSECFSAKATKERKEGIVLFSLIISRDINSLFCRTTFSLFRVSITWIWCDSLCAYESCPTNLFNIIIFMLPPPLLRRYPYVWLLKFFASIWAIIVKLREKTFSIWKFHVWILFLYTLIATQSDVLATVRDLFLYDR